MANEIIIPENSKTINLTQGYIAFVDEEDFQLVSQYCWQTEINGKSIYAMTKIIIGREQQIKSVGRRVYKPRAIMSCIKMHRLIMNAPKDLLVDHKNGNGLDNRKSNLRFCTKQQNQMNQRPQRNNKYSSFKGVCFMKGKRNPWTAHIGLNNKLIHIGYFPSEIEAATAYNESALKYHGEFARLNIIP